MCDYDPGCTKPVDPVARALSENPREKDAVLLVICPPRHCLLGAVYDLPERGRVLCTPHFPFRYGSLFNNPADPEKIGHFHPGLDRLDSYAETEIEYGRCRCGTWSYRPADVGKWLAPWSQETAAWRSELGMPPQGQSEIVRALTLDGQEARVGRAYAESQGWTVVGTVNRKRTRRPYMLGNYVSMADARRRPGN